MYIRNIQYNIACDGCETMYQGDPCIHLNMSSAEKEALESGNGWIKHDEKHYCPNCYITDLNGKTVLGKVFKKQF